MSNVFTSQLRFRPLHHQQVNSSTAFVVSSNPILVMRAGWRIDDACVWPTCLTCATCIILLRTFTPHTRARAVQCIRTLPRTRVRVSSFSTASYECSHPTHSLLFKSSLDPTPELDCVASAPIAPTISPTFIHARKDQQQNPTKSLGWHKSKAATR